MTTKKLNCGIQYSDIQYSDIQYSDIQYSDIFSSDITRQAAVTKMFASLLERREDASASPPVGPDYEMS